MHPMIKPALRRSWHDRQTVRYGITPAHSVLFGPLDTATESFLALLDGTRGLPALRAAAKRLGLGASAADRISERLANAGVLEDATADRAAAARISERLRPDLAVQSLLTRAPGAGVRQLTDRRRTWVQIRGAGRVGAAVAVALAQAGVGRVDVVDGGRVEPADTSPGGIPAAYTGRRRDGAARAVVRAAVPWQQPASEPPEQVTLVLFAPRDSFRAYVPDPVPAEDVLTAGTPHLYAGVVEATGFVGPLVLPGRTACAGCLLRHRTRHEPGLPLLMGQWRTARTPGVPACDAALATTVSGLAAAMALSYLDGTAESAAGVRSELALPSLEMTREHIPPHPECPCRAEERPDSPSATERHRDADGTTPVRTARAPLSAGTVWEGAGGEPESSAAATGPVPPPVLPKSPAPAVTPDGLPLAGDVSSQSAANPAVTERVPEQRRRRHRTGHPSRRRTEARRRPPVGGSRGPDSRPGSLPHPGGN